MATKKVGSGENLQRCLDAAEPGDRLVLEAGAAYTGPFTLPKKDGSQWITLCAPSTGRARIAAPGRGERAIQTAPGAHHWEIQNLEICPVPGALVYDLVRFGEIDQRAEEMPHHLSLKDCAIHGLPGEELQRCVTLNSGATWIRHCEITEAKGIGYDTQAICGWNGTGPYHIEGNTLSAAGEGSMFGGADPSIEGLVPTDILITENRLYKPLEWRDEPWTVKNLLELKNARHVFIQGNTLEYNWAAAQQGFAVVLTPVNQDGKSPWSVVEDVSFFNNTVRHVSGGVQIRGRRHTDRNARDIRITNNRFLIDGVTYGGSGTFMQVTECDDLLVERNLIWQTGSAVTAYGVPCQRSIWRDNVLMHGPWGVHGDDTPPGPESLKRYFPGVTWKGNVLVGTPEGLTLEDTDE